MSSAGYASFKLSNELCPITLTGGIAANVPGGMIPITQYTENASYGGGVPSSDAGPDLNNFFANYIPLPGSTLIAQQISQYPFANQTVAANAVIAQPLTISLRMLCPARGPDGYALKLSTMMGLQSTLKQHNNSGGTYTVITPAAFYTNCLMLAMTDTSGGESNQAQISYQLDFYQPLLTLADAQQAANSAMNKVNSGTQINGNPAWSSVNNSVGDPSSLAAPGVSPPQSNLPGSGVSGGNGP